MTHFGETLARARAGDDDAVARLYDAYRGAVFAAVRTRLSPLLRRHYDTNDVWQSVFVEVLKDLPRFEDRGEAAFRNWLLLKVRTKVDAKLRRHLGAGRRRVAERLGTHDAEQLHGRDTGPATRAERRENSDALHRALDELGEPDQTLVRLRSERGLQFAEIAAQLGFSSADAARKRYARALLALRRASPG